MAEAKQRGTGNYSTIEVGRRVALRIWRNQAIDVVVHGSVPAAAAFFAWKNWLEPNLRRANPPALPGGLTAQATTEELILAMAKSWGGAKNDKEEQNWVGSYTQPISNLIDVSLAPVIAAQVCTYDTFNRMRTSQNPFSQDAAATFDLLESEQTLEFTWAADAKTEFSGGARYRVDEEGRLKYGYALGVDYVLNGSSAKTLAGTLAGLAERFKRYRIQDQLLPDGTPSTTRQAVLDAHFGNPTQKLVEHTAAMAIIAESYIYLAGLLGEIYDQEISLQPELARNFILSGGTADSPKWKDYIRTNFLY